MMKTTPQGSLPPAIIFDMDGTFIDVREFLCHIDYEDKRLTAYHHATVEAPANEKVFELLSQTIDAGIYPIVITARGERWRDLTHGCILDKGFYAETMYMRAEDDWREDSIIKGEILAEIRKQWNIVGAIDDNPRVVALWESEGIPTITVPSAYTDGNPHDMVIPEWWDEVISRYTQSSIAG